MNYKRVPLSPEAHNTTYKLAKIRHYLRPYNDGFLTLLFTFLAPNIDYKY
jgi:hypothetical protein